MSVDTLEQQHRPARVLLVEDNYGDVLLTKRAFSKARHVNELSVVESGEQALAFLRREGEYANKLLPDLILLDLNLPKLSGQDVLQEIKSDPRLKRIPVIILSSSQAEQDVVKSYELHANGYVVKPVSSENFQQAVSKLEQFWFALVVIPNSDEQTQAP